MGKLTASEAKFANRFGYSNINPFEVVKKVSDRCLEVRAMTAVETEEGKNALAASFQPGGFVGHFENHAQRWDITSNPEAPVIRIRLHKDGHWYSSWKSRFVLAEKPVKFYDYNF